MPTTYASPSQGFTLIELLVTVTLLAVLGALALPRFQELQDRWQLTRVVKEMESTLTVARSEAIRRGGNIGIQKVSNNTNGCQNAATTQEWGCGWFIYADLNNNNSWQANEPKIQEINLDGSINVMRTRSGANIAINRFGIAGGLNAQGFVFSPSRSGISSSATQALCMSSGGRIRTIAAADCS